MRPILFILFLVIRALVWARRAATNQPTTPHKKFMTLRVPSMVPKYSLRYSGRSNAAAETSPGETLTSDRASALVRACHVLRSVPLNPTMVSTTGLYSSSDIGIDADTWRHASSTATSRPPVAYTVGQIDSLEGTSTKLTSLPNETSLISKIWG